MIRVFIADDHAMVREGLRRLVADCPGFRVVGEAATGDEVLDRLGTAHVDVLLLDIKMPGRPFLDLLRDVRQRHPLVRIIVLSAYPEDHYAVRALKAGASGYITKDHSIVQVVEAIAKVSRGGVFVSPELAQQLAEELRAPRQHAPHEALSDRELEVLKGIAVGESAKEIAARLSLSPKTVGTYRSRVLSKLRLKTNADLVRFVLEQGLEE